MKNRRNSFFKIITFKYILIIFLNVYNCSSLPSPSPSTNAAGSRGCSPLLSRSLRAGTNVPVEEVEEAEEAEAVEEAEEAEETAEEAEDAVEEEAEEAVEEAEEAE